MRRKKVYPSIDFVNTEAEAKELCDTAWNFRYTPYMKRVYEKPHYTTWTSKDGTVTKFAVFYYYHTDRLA